MPQVDLETLVSACAGGSCDRKIACETLGNGDCLGENDDRSDLPPESFWLAKDAEFDWFDRNAFYERSESTKGISNSTNLNPNLNPSSNSSSQRFSRNLKSKASIIGLPKTQKTNYVDPKNRRNCKPNTRLFPKRSGSTGKSDGPMVEPSSPKVSCMGRVRSRKDRRRRRNRQRSSEKPTEIVPKSAGRRKTGFLESFRAIFRSGGRDKPETKTNAPPAKSTPPRKSAARDTRDTRDTRDIRSRLPAEDIDASTESTPRNSVSFEAPGLGGMKRFVSGRRSETWGAGIES